MRGLAGVVLAVLLLVGCAARDDDGRRAAQVATAFSTALKSEDAATACSLLAPETLYQLEKSAKASCDEAILDEELPEPGALVRTEVFGSEARLAFAADTMFFTDLGGRWQLVAAGCTRRGDLPYDCELDGG